MNPLRLFAVSQFIFIALLFLGKWKHPCARLWIWFCLGIVCYLLMPVLRADPIYEFFLLIDLTAVFSISFTVWMLSSFLFDDHFQYRTKHTTLLLALEVVSLMVFYRVPDFFFSWGMQHPIFANLLGLFPQLFHLPFFLLALVVAVGKIREDLVEKRRALRAVFMATITGYSGLVLIIQIYQKGKFDRVLLETVHLSFIIIVSYVLLYNLVFQQHLIINTKPRITAPSENHDPNLVAKLNRQMTERKAYRIAGMTIRKLASLLPEPEYKVRRHINQNLGYKNFNDFLNSHRIAEACQIFKDAAADNRAILDISLELGYQSLSTFNKAFKDQTKQTPSTYRKAFKT